MAGKANPRFEQALAFAAQAHAAVHQERKGTDFPVRRPSHPGRGDSRPVRLQRGRDRGGIPPRHDRRHGRHRGRDQRNLQPTYRRPCHVSERARQVAPVEDKKAAHDRAPRAGAGSGGACSGGRRQARQRPRDHRHAPSSRAGEDVGPLQSRPERAAFLLPAHRGDPAAEGSGEPAVQDARLRDSDALPRSRPLDDLLRREAASAPLTTHGHTSPTRSSTGVPTTLRSSSPRSGSRRVAFRRVSCASFLPATPGRAAGSSRACSSGRSISVREDGRARPTCSRWSSWPRAAMASSRWRERPESRSALSSRSGTTAPESRRAWRAFVSSSGSTPVGPVASTTSCSTEPCRPSARRAATAPMKR